MNSQGSEDWQVHLNQERFLNHFPSAINLGRAVFDFDLSSDEGESDDEVEIMETIFPVQSSSIPMCELPKRRKFDKLYYLPLQKWYKSLTPMFYDLMRDVILPYIGFKESFRLRGVNKEFQKLVEATTFENFPCPRLLIKQTGKKKTQISPKNARQVCRSIMKKQRFRRYAFSCNKMIRHFHNNLVKLRHLWPTLKGCKSTSKLSENFTSTWITLINTENVSRFIWRK